MSTHLEVALMTLPREQKINDQDIESMKLAVEEAGIQAIHPDKMEEFAEYLVQNARKQEPVPWRTGSPLEE
tara:strand:- start:391 stop:603 length:213 start_codon:yes stop_codon:yes gene_type:complete